MLMVGRWCSIDPATKLAGSAATSVCLELSALESSRLGNGSGQIN